MDTYIYYSIFQKNYALPASTPLSEREEREGGEGGEGERGRKRGRAKDMYTLLGERRGGGTEGGGQRGGDRERGERDMHTLTLTLY